MGSTAIRKPDTAQLHFKDQYGDEAEPSDDATVKLDGDLGVAPDEDAGADPYNHTGSFKRTVR